MKARLPSSEVNRSVLVFRLRIVKPVCNPRKSAVASKVALLFRKLLPTDVRLLNCITNSVVRTFSKVIVSTKMVKLDEEAKKVVSVIVRELVKGRRNRLNRTSKNAK